MIENLSYADFAIWLMPVLLLLLPSIQALWLWNVGYGFYLEQKIEQGKTWVYLPRLWVQHRMLWRVISWCVDGLTTALFLWVWVDFMTQFGFAKSTPLWSIYLSGVAILVPIFFYLRVFIGKKRYQQQESLFFALTLRELEQKGAEYAQAAESEAKSMATYTLQRDLLKADQEGLLHKFLKNGLQISADPGVL